MAAMFDILFEAWLLLRPKTKVCPPTEISTKKIKIDSDSKTVISDKQK